MKNKYILHCMNTGKICIFGKRWEDASGESDGSPIWENSVIRDSRSTISVIMTVRRKRLYICDSEQMRYANLYLPQSRGWSRRLRNGIPGNKAYHYGNEASAGR